MGLKFRNEVFWLKKIAIIAQNEDKFSQLALASAKELLYGRKKIIGNKREIHLKNCVVGIDGVPYKYCIIEAITRMGPNTRRNLSPVMYNILPENETGAILQTNIDNDDKVVFCSTDYDNETIVVNDEGQFGYMEYLAISLSK